MSAAINGTNPSPGSSQTSNAAGGKAQLKMSTNVKTLDGARKQAGSPIDTPQRKSTPKAWTGGNNPITQRSSNSIATNGVNSAAKAAPTQKTPRSPSSDSNSAEKHATDRMLFLLGSLVGLPATFTVKNGDKYSGIFSGASLESSESRYVFKMVKRLQQVNGDAETAGEYIGIGADHVMTLDTTDVVDLAVPQVKLDKVQSRAQNGAPNSFRTDADISGNLSLRERELKPWQPSDTDSGMGLEEEGGLGSDKPWDQFAANERLHGVKTDYDENIYTTTIDRSHPLYKQRQANADRIAREIEAGSALSAHVAEERGLAVPDDSGLDEEDKYSGVRREFPTLHTGQPGRYTPPARRAPTSQSTVPGAPVDPAIISSSLARPTSTAKPATPTPTTQSSDAAATSISNTPASKTATQPLKSSGSTGADSNPAKTSTETSTAPKPANTTGSQKPTPALKTATASSNQSKKPTTKPENATATVEHDLLESFRLFSSTEKMRMQERQRSQARQDKAVKLNDLKKFSEMFKLNTAVPDDMLPLLAKEKSKQEQIKERNIREMSEVKTTPTQPATASTTDPKAARPANAVTSPTAPFDRNGPARQQRTGPSNYPSGSSRGLQAQNMPPRQGGALGQRLAMTSQQHKVGNTYTTPHPVPIQDIRIPSGPSASSSGAQTPSSSISTQRFNAKAHEFRPNPAANTFMPGSQASNTSSPRVQTPARPESRKKAITSFFGAQKPKVPSDPSILDNGFNPIKRMKAEVAGDPKLMKMYAENGGIPNAFKTGPVWDHPKGNEDRSYLEYFNAQAPVQPLSAPHSQLGGPPMPHQHQLPPHLQQQVPTMPQQHTAQNTPRHPQAQPHGPGVPQFEGGHPMQYSVSQNSAHPRPGPPYGYGPQMPQGMPPGTFVQQQMAPYGMSPHVQHRQPGPSYVAPMPVMGGHMMTQTPSNGPYMVPSNPQMQMYPAGPNQVYAQHGGPMVMPPGSSGFPSPRPHGAQMMSHQGSQQGHIPQPQVMYMQQHNGQPQMMAMQQGPMSTPGRHFQQPHQQMHYGSPHQGHHYPQQSHRGTPSTQYSQPMMPTQSMPPHTGNPSGPPAPNGEEAK